MPLPKKVDPVAAALQRLGAAADCGNPASLWRTWCIAVAWDEGQAAPLPGGPLIGLTIRIEDGKKVSTALVDGVTFAALAITKSADGTKVKLNDITPSNPDESQAVAFAVFGVASVLKGKSERAEVDKPLASYIASSAGAYPAAKGAREWTWTGKNPSMLRAVRGSWVLIEVDKAGSGIWATVLTDRWRPKS